MKRRDVLALGAAILTLFPAAAQAQREIKLTGISGKSSISVSELTGATVEERNLVQVLSNDLNLSGHFVVAPSPAEFEIKGRTASNGSALQADLQVVSRTGAVLLSQRFSGAANQSRALAHQINDAVVEKVKNMPGIATTRLALIGKRSGSKELYVCDYDGENLRQVTSDHSISESPQWFPNGEELVYTSFLKGNAQLIRINPATGARSQLSSRPGINIGGAVSPDGRRAASVLSFEGRPEVYVQDMAARRVTRITTTKMASKASPSWSPDGQKLVFVSEHTGKPNLFIASAAGGQPTQLTTGMENVGPDWGPNGWIAYSTRTGGRYSIRLVNPANPRDQRVVSPADADYEDPAWARDGRHLVCKRTAGYKSTLVLLDIEAGGNEKPYVITRQAGDWMSPDWTP
ncbi:MAG: DPP IV N-terminal domain-containing protein [Kiritimatiellia bacterium]